MVIGNEVTRIGSV